MIVTEIEPRLPYPQGPARSGGIHWSKLIRSMAVTYGKLDPKWVHDMSLEEVPGDGERWWNGLDLSTRARMLMGLAWESQYLNSLMNVVHQPGEMSCEGVYMNQDGEELTSFVTEGRRKYALVVHEVKLTYKSLNTVSDIRKEWLWQMQLMGYCKAKGARHAQIHVLFVAGDYSYPLKPTPRIWGLEYEQQEIDDAWELAMSYRRHYEAQEREDLMRDTTPAARRQEGGR